MEEEKVNFQAGLSKDNDRELKKLLDEICPGKKRGDQVMAMMDLAQRYLKENDLDDLTPYIDSVQESFKSALNQFLAISKRFDEQRQNNAAKIKQVKNDLLGQLKNANEQIASEKDNVGMLIDELAGRDAQIFQITEDMESLARNCEDQEKKASDSYQQIEKLKEKSVDLEGERDEAMKQANKALVRAEQLREELKGVDGIKTQNANLEGQIKALREGKEEQKQELIARDQKIEELRELLEKRESEIRQKEREVGDLKTKISQLETRYEVMESSHRQEMERLERLMQNQPESIGQGKAKSTGRKSRTASKQDEPDQASMFDGETNG